jgi:hypothetical protein
VVSLKKSFVPAGRLQAERREIANDLALVFGYPSEETELNPGLNSMGVQPMSYMTGTLDPPAGVLNYSPDVDIFLEYAKTGNMLSSGKPADLPQPHGISGGGIWACDVSTDGLWSPESARLIGIEKSAHAHGWVRGTQIQHWAQMLAEDLPELRHIVICP